MAEAAAQRGVAGVSGNLRQAIAAAARIASVQSARHRMTLKPTIIYPSWLVRLTPWVTESANAVASVALHFEFLILLLSTNVVGPIRREIYKPEYGK